MEANNAEEKKFLFPFQPPRRYEIQLGFMKSLYKTLDEGRIGIFESPTGTGKSLSIICSALQWIVDNEDNLELEVKPSAPEKKTTTTTTTSNNNNNNNNSNSSNSNAADNSTPSDPAPAQPDWVQEFLKKQENDKKKFALVELEEKRAKIQKRLEKLRKNPFSHDDRPTKKRKKESEADEDSDVAFLLDDYDSEDDTKKNKYEDSDDDGKEDDINIRKIYYCSRTHSQLTQFANEVKKTVFHTDDSFSKKTHVVCLASRKNLCINDDVLKLQSVSRINDKCLDMQKSGAHKCHYNNQKTIQLFSDHTLMKVRDIEELASLGSRLDACPYYGARKTIGAAQLVVLPYQSLLHKSTRESLGISLKNNIVIVDEAHNLVEAINDMYAVEISATQIAQALSQLQQYLDSYPYS